MRALRSSVTVALMVVASVPPVQHGQAWVLGHGAKTPLFADFEVIVAGSGPMQGFSTATQTPLFSTANPCEPGTEQYPQFMLRTGPTTMSYVCGITYFANSIRSINTTTGNVTSTHRIDTPSSSNGRAWMESFSAAAGRGVYCPPTEPLWCLFRSGTAAMLNKGQFEDLSYAFPALLHVYEDTVVYAGNNAVHFFDAVSGAQLASAAVDSTWQSSDLLRASSWRFSGGYALLIRGTSTTEPIEVVVFDIVGHNRTHHVKLTGSQLQHVAHQTSSGSWTASQFYGLGQQPVVVTVDPGYEAMVALTNRSADGRNVSLTGWRFNLNATSQRHHPIRVDPEVAVQLDVTEGWTTSVCVAAEGSSQYVVCATGGQSSVSETGATTVVDAATRRVVYRGTGGKALWWVEKAVACGPSCHELLVASGQTGGTISSSSFGARFPNGALGINTSTGKEVWAGPYEVIGPYAAYDRVSECAVLAYANGVVCVNATGQFE